MYTAKEMYHLAGCPEAAPATRFVRYITRHLRPIARHDFNYLLDLSSMKFIYLSPCARAVTGYRNEEIMEEGHDFLLSRVHEEDKDRLKHIFRLLFCHYFAQPPEERSRFRYNFDYRLVRGNGQACWLLQQVSFVETDGKGSPTVSYNVCTDITSIKENRLMAFIITRKSETGSGKEVSKTFFPPQTGMKLTPRENEIVRLIMEGYSSREISDKLFISEHTVRTHRQNMLKKNSQLYKPFFPGEAKAQDSIRPQK